MASAGVAATDDAADGVKDPVVCTDKAIASMDCSPRLADTMQPLHCGDKNYAALQQSPLMKQNLTADPVNGADECSFGSNRIRVFGPSTGSDKSSIACEKKPDPQLWVVPPGADTVVVQAWGASGGNTADSSKKPFSALGGFGGFAEFDGRDYTKPWPDALNADNGLLAPGDVLQVVVGCKPVTVGTPNSSGDRSAGAGGGSTAVLWIGVTDPTVADKVSTDDQRYQQASATAQKAGLADAQGHPILVVAGGGGGAARDAFGGDGQLGGGKGSYASGDGHSDPGHPQDQVGRGGNHDGSGTGGSGAAKGGNGLDGTGGAAYGGGPGGVGFNPGGQGGYGAWPGGGGGGGYGGGGAGSTDVPDANHKCNGCDSGGGGGGGSVSWGGDPTQSQGLDQDGFVAIQWRPDVLGGADCTASCRAVFATCTIGGSNSGATTWRYVLPTGATSAGFYVIGAAGGGAIDDQGTLTPGGSGGYVGGGGVVSLDPDKIYAPQVGCPGTWSKTANYGGGGGGSSAVVVTSKLGAPDLSEGSAVAVAGGGGGAAADAAGGAGGVVGDDTQNAQGSHGLNGGGAGGGGGSEHQDGGSGDQGGTNGQNGYGGTGGYGGGRLLHGDFGGAEGQGPYTSGKQGLGGSGYLDTSAGSGGGGGGGGVGGGGGGNGGQSDGYPDASAGGGGGSFGNHQVVTPAPPSTSSWIADVFLVWNGLASALPGSIGIGMKVIGGVAQGVRAAVQAAPNVPAALKAPKSSPLAFGFISWTWDCVRPDQDGGKRFTCQGRGLQSSR